MNQEQKTVAKKRNEEYVRTLREVGRVKEEVIALIEEDLQSGLTIEQTNRYKQPDLDISQMRIYSRCLRKGYPDEVVAVLANKKMNGYQMAVALEFYEKGVPLEQIKAVVDRDDTPSAMVEAYRSVLGNLDRIDPETTEKATEAKEFEESGEIRALLEEIRSVVSKIDYQEKRYDVLNDKLKNLVSARKDEEDQVHLLKSIQKKDRMLEEMQDKISQADATIARLRGDLAEKERDIRKLQRQAGDLKEAAPSDSIQPAVPEETKEASGAQIPYVYGIPAFYHPPFVDAGGNVIPVPQMERAEKKTSGVLALLSRLAIRKKSRQDLVKLVAGGELVKEQLVMIRTAIEKGLKENQLVELINSRLPAENMMEIIEIAVLENSMDY